MKKIRLTRTEKKYLQYFSPNSELTPAQMLAKYNAARQCESSLNSLITLSGATEQLKETASNLRSILNSGYVKSGRLTESELTGIIDGWKMGSGANALVSIHEDCRQAAALVMKNL